MGVTTFSLKYRPIKIGFLIRDESIEDLVTAAGINTMLWGGKYNPIIPVSEGNNSYSKQLIDLFSVDILFAITHTNEIDLIIKNNPYLNTPHNYSKGIFYEDWDTKKNVFACLDSINIVTHYWEKELKHKSQKYKSNYVLVKWDNKDLLNNLFSISFGYFPTSYNLKDDFLGSFIKGLKSKEINIEQNEALNGSLAHLISPINATSFELNGYGGNLRNDGIYIGEENNFFDLLNFWNLRASGSIIEFVPQNYIDRFKNYVKAHIKRLDSIPNKHHNIDDWISIYFRGDQVRTIKDIICDFQGKKKFLYSPCSETIWNGMNVEPINYYFNYQQSMANVDISYSKYRVSFTLPEKEFIFFNRNRRIDSQQLIISVEAISEFEYPGHTLKPPFIRSLNEFYSREIIFDPWQLRSEQTAIGLIINSNTNSLSLYPISHQELIERIFKLAGFNTELSQAGLLAKQIIKSMREDMPLEACRVFKITGVRKLVNSIKASENIEWNYAIKTIGENHFSKFKKLYIESRKTPELTPFDTFNYLLKKKIFIPSMKSPTDAKWIYKCINCGLKEDIPIKSFENNWRCPYCEQEQYMPPHIIDTFKRMKDTFWQFRKGGLFAKDNNQEGSIPVILGLLTFSNILHMHNFAYSTSLNLVKSNKCEIDFCILHYNFRDKIQLGIAECKSEGQEIDEHDINNLKIIQDEIEKLKIECYLIFVKTADRFNEKEIERFKSLNQERRKLIILSNKELEPYHPYWDINEKDKLPESSVIDLMGMYRNSVFIYLSGSYY